MMKRPLAEYTLFAEAWIFLAIARLMLIFIPFRKVAKLLGRAMYEAPATILPDPAVPSRISTAIQRAGRRSPWRTKCFEQAVAAKIMLKLRGITSTVYFGVNNSTPGRMLAHAWLKSNSTTVTGGPESKDFTIISWFGS